MSPRNPGDEFSPPGELNLATGQLPTAGAVPPLPSAAGTTPGLSLAGARVPGAPTLPDIDPVLLSSLVQRLAGELFSSPSSAPALPVSPVGTTPLEAAPLSAPVTPAMPTNIQPVPTSAPAVPASLPTSVPASPVAIPAPPSSSVPSSPFEAPLSFDALFQAAPPFGSSISSLPLLDTRAAPEPVIPTAPPQTPASVPSFELTPVTGLDLSSAPGTPLDPYALKREFPILQQRVHGRELVWLDNAATTQKPRAVIDRLSKFYENENSNVHRAAHTLAARATDAYESARDTVKRFLNAPSVKDIVFVRGTTEGINFIAQSWGRRNVNEGDEIVVSHLEHHANIVPWQLLAKERGAKLRVAPVDDRGQIILEDYEKLLGPKTKIVSISQVSNALGTITPIHEMVEIAHRHGALAMVDGAQAVSHLRVDVQALNCDFYVFSGHKVFGPTGIGAVYGRSALLEAMPPWQGGGNMIRDVTFEQSKFHGPPERFEAGTGNIADAVGLGAALEWVNRVGLERIAAHEHDLLLYGTEKLLAVPGLRLIGTAPDKAGVLSFVLAGQKTEEVGGMLDKEGIAVRSGHHCAQPILRRFGLEATVRASLAPYNTREDLDALAAALHRIQAGSVSR